MVKKLKITLKTADNYIDNEISGIYDQDREVLNKELEIIIKTNKFNVTNNLIEIIYEVVDSKEQFIYKIEY